MGKWGVHASSFIFDQIVIRHKSSDEFDFGPLVSMAHLYVFWNEIWPWHIGLRWAIVALWATCSKIWTVWFCHTARCPKDADRMANSVDPDQTIASGAEVTGPVWSESSLKIPSYPSFKVPDACTFLLQASSGALGPKLLEENGWWAGAGQQQTSPILQQSPRPTTHGSCRHQVWDASIRDWRIPNRATSTGMTCEAWHLSVQDRCQP